MRKKIMFVNNNLSGLLHFRMDVMRHFTEKGYEVVAVAPLTENTEKEIDGIRVEFVPFSRTSTNPLHDLKYLWRLVKLFHKERPQYAFMFTIKPNIYGTLAARICGVHSSMMMAGLGYTFTNKRLSSRIARLLYSFALKFSDYLMLLNQDNVDTVKRLRIGDEKKILFLQGGEGVNLSHYTYCNNESKEVKFLFVGRLLKEKGIYDFADAAREVKRQYHDNVEFQIAGGLDKDYPNSLKQEDLNELVNSGVVTYLGRIDMVEKLKEPGVVIAIPSYYSEGLNRSLMEGCAAGKPIITTNQPGCRETVVDGKNGYMVPVCQPQLFAEAIMKYINLNKEGKQKMSLESRRLAEERFDVKDVIKTYDDIIIKAHLS